MDNIVDVADLRKFRDWQRWDKTGQINSPTELPLPALGVSQHAIDQHDGFLLLQGIKRGCASLVECLLTSAAHSPPTVLSVSH